MGKLKIRPYEDLKKDGIIVGVRVRILQPTALQDRANPAVALPTIPLKQFRRHICLFLGTLGHQQGFHKLIICEILILHALPNPVT